MLLSITKLQNLKAIHNGVPQYRIQRNVVVNHKTTKFESNSQHAVPKWQPPQSCCQSQNYKIWKQFTTKTFKVTINVLLLSITKLQNLKAIHNVQEEVRQQVLVVVNHKTTKFESNSQQDRTSEHALVCCCQSQNYKIWKQFTTAKMKISIAGLLLSITKLQNLKAIHNNEI